MSTTDSLVDDRGTASSDSGIASSDSGTASSDSGIASSDSGTASSDTPCPACPFQAGKIDGPMKAVFSDSASEQIAACNEVLALLTEAWATPVVGRDLAYTLCDHIRDVNGVERLVELCTSSELDVQLASMAALEQCLTPVNRDRLVRLELDQFIQIVWRSDSQHPKMVKAALGILESLFKQSAHTCARLIDVGALDAVLYMCRSSDVGFQRSCAAALANCAMYGTPQTQRNMVQRDAAEWLFRLAFSCSSSVQYYACLAISILASNEDIEAQIRTSRTLDLIAPFVSSHDPLEFARGDKSHCQGRSADWLRRLIIVLQSGNKAAQCLAAFHFAMEAGIKKEQGNLQVFQDIGAVQPLQSVAMYGNRHGRLLAKSALHLMGHELPKHLSLELLTWKARDIEQWLGDIGLAQYSKAFKDCAVDGELLASLTDEDMREDLMIKNRLHRRKLQREIVRLCSVADYSQLDMDGVGQWLCDVGREMARYRGAFIESGVTMSMLCHLTDDDLRECIGVKNAQHRKKILLATDELLGLSTAIQTAPTSAATTATTDVPVVVGNVPRRSLYSFDAGDGVPAATAKAPPRDPVDVFISYRRSNGSQLASLLKVHLRLKLRHLNVFLDVDELGAGKFDEALLDFIGEAKNFILVLSPNSLDRWFGDIYLQDWVHKEVAKAVECGSNIIPVLDETFVWPDAEKLPEDIRGVMKFNGVAWSHIYQDAAIEKIVNFLEKAGSRSQMSAAAATSPPGAVLTSPDAHHCLSVTDLGVHGPRSLSPKSRKRASPSPMQHPVRAHRSLSGSVLSDRTSTYSPVHGHRPSMSRMRGTHEDQHTSDGTS